MKSFTKTVFFFLTLLMVFAISAGTVLAVTDNKMRSVATPVRDKDFSSDPENAPVLEIKAEHPVRSGAMFLLELSNNAQWVYNDCQAASLNAMFTKNGNSFEANDGNKTVSGTAGLSYTLLQVSSGIVQVVTVGEIGTNEYIGIPIIVKLDGIGEASVTVSGGEVSGITSGEYVFANKGNADKIGYNIYSNAVETENGAIEGDIFIESTAAAEGNDISFTLPVGYHYESKDGISVKGEGSFASVRLDRASLSGGDRLLTLYLKGVTKSTQSGTLTISNIKAVPININNSEKGDVTMTFSGFGLNNERFTFTELMGEKEEPAEEPNEEQAPPEPVQTPLTVNVTDGVRDITINGETVELDTTPFINEDSRLMVPVRFIARAYGINDDDIEWNEKEKTVTINDISSQSVIVFIIGQPSYTVNGSDVLIDTAPIIKDGRTFLPARFAADALGIDVSYDAETRTAQFVR